MLDEISNKVALFWPVVSTAFAAVAGWFFIYWHKWYADRKASRLDRINKQLRELYGPLYAQLKASDSVWEAFTGRHWPGHRRDSYFSEGAEVTDQEKAVWRNWMSNVFEPYNATTEKLILQNIDLIDQDQIPAAFISALAHVAAYKAVLASWKDSDFSYHTSVNNWPNIELLSFVEPEYKRLKKLQGELIGLKLNA
ncbi:hypothetical protein RZO07_19425 [Pseudomonas protegens]|uniref:hypothetical protein n=1 Tax=Pseudomonas protegens TaxID=380021 RepID=UPI0029372198|nr:hypothetical protein [Pseudomonas protegens]WOE77483.1 hypothetical protein RZO07_19425 [Pseudomonas protegens]